MATRRKQSFAPTRDIPEAYRRCDPMKPLEGDRLKHWYVDCSAERGAPHFVDRLLTAVVYATDSRETALGRALVSGHRGCGKSTELHALEGKLATAGYRVVYVDMLKEATPDQYDAEVVTIGVLRQVLQELGTRGLPNAGKLIDGVREWFGSALMEKAKVAEGQLEVGGGAEVAAKLGGLLKLLADFRGYIKRTSQDKLTATVEYRRYLKELSEHLNGILVRASLQAQREEGTRNGVAVIVDGLDRIEDPELQREVFIDYGEFLATLQVHKVLTVPISMVCSEHHRTVCGRFGVAQIHMLPSVQAEMDAGLAKLGDIVHKRCDASLFDQAALDVVCRTCGGDIRHLMELAQEALAQTDTGHVTPRDAEGAANALSRSFALWLGEPHYSILTRYAERNAVPPVDDQESLDLLYSAAILCYCNGDGEPWYQAHPAVRRLSAFTDRVQRATGTQES